MDFKNIVSLLYNNDPNNPTTNTSASIIVIALTAFSLVFLFIIYHSILTFKFILKYLKYQYKVGKFLPTLYYS